MKKNKTLIVSYSDYQGGAARAAYRLFQCLTSQNIEINMLVDTKGTDDWRITGPKNKLDDGIARIRARIEMQIAKLQGTSNKVLHSPGLIGSNALKSINNSDVNVVNLHWVNNGQLSIRQIGKIKHPIVWTLHDMWPFTGSEHYSDDTDLARWIKGYTVGNRPISHTGLDIDRLSWKLKKHYWKSPIHVVAPSAWLAQCATRSKIFSNSNIRTIPNAIDLTVFKPISQEFSRNCLNLPPKKKLILFGALGGSKDPRKGWDLLQPALKSIGSRTSNVEAIVFGQAEPKASINIGMPIRWIGHVSDDQTLALLYNSADLMIVPSRQENLPQSATEAQSCGCPVVAFDRTGLPSAVQHINTGYLASEMDSKNLEHGIEWILNLQDNEIFAMRTRSRERAMALWEPKIIASAYFDVYEDAARTAKLIYKS